MTVVHLDPELKRKMAVCRRILAAVANDVRCREEAIVLLLHATAASAAELQAEDREDLNKRCMEIFRKALADYAEDDAS
jgi:hypothetical protein